MQIQTFPHLSAFPPRPTARRPGDTHRPSTVFFASQEPSSLERLDLWIEYLPILEEERTFLRALRKEKVNFVEYSEINLRPMAKSIGMSETTARRILQDFPFVEKHAVNNTKNSPMAYRFNDALKQMLDELHSPAGQARIAAEQAQLAAITQAVRQDTRLNDTTAFDALTKVLKLKFSFYKKVPYATLLHHLSDLRFPGPKPLERQLKQYLDNGYLEEGTTIGNVRTFKLSTRYQASN